MNLVDLMISTALDLLSSTMVLIYNLVSEVVKDVILHAND